MSSSVMGYQYTGMGSAEVSDGATRYAIQIGAAAEDLAGIYRGAAALELAYAEYLNDDGVRSRYFGASVPLMWADAAEDGSYSVYK